MVLLLLYPGVRIVGLLYRLDGPLPLPTPVPTTLSHCQRPHIWCGFQGPAFGARANTGENLFKGDCVARDAINGLQGIPSQHVRLEWAPFSNVENLNSWRFDVFVEHNMQPYRPRITNNYQLIFTHTSTTEVTKKITLTHTHLHPLPCLPHPYFHCQPLTCITLAHNISP